MPTINDWINQRLAKVARAREPMKCQYSECIHPQVYYRQETCWEQLLRPRRAPERSYNPYEHLTPEQLVVFWEWNFSKSILAREDSVRSAYIKNALEIAKELETRE